MKTVVHTDEYNPFLRYRPLLASYRRAIEAGWSDGDFVGLVNRLDGAIAGIDGKGFEVTPFTREPRLAEALGVGDHDLWIKNDTGNVGGSHKARHLFGVALHHAIDAREHTAELAIASCGNAALAAAVVARAEERPLRVFIPTWAEPSIVERLASLEARIEVCERREGESGDPTYLRFQEAVEEGAVPFSVQSTVTPGTIDGGRTLGWEVAEQLGDLRVTGTVRAFLQIGGGAMATAVAQGIGNGLREQWLDIDPIAHAVQTSACAPLCRAWTLIMDHAAVPPDLTPMRRAALLADDPDRINWVLTEAQRDPEAFMWPWTPVGESAADGILDDVTYDWLGVVAAMLRTGGWPIVVEERDVAAAHHAVHQTTTIDASPTGTAGLAGLLPEDVALNIEPGEKLVGFVTGVSR